MPRRPRYTEKEVDLPQMKGGSSFNRTYISTDRKTGRQVLIQRRRGGIPLFFDWDKWVPIRIWRKK